MASYAGKVLGGRYKLLRQVATGGMGEVWTARDSVSGRHIAAKILKPELAGQDTFLQRLRMEARNAMQIEHPNLAAVLDHGEEDGVGWIIMEYVEGRPFNEYLRDGNRIAPDQLIPVLIQTAYALQAAHSKEVVHRDIKPSNLIITPKGLVKLTDFGISVAPNQATMTEAGMVMGTAQYLPPEQAMGEPATHSGDLYALGVIAYEALAGKRPFTGKTQVDVAFSHVNDPVPPLPKDIPAELSDVVMHLLRKRPEDRPKDGAELVRELVKAAKALGIDTSPKPLSLPDSATAEKAPPTMAQKRAGTRVRKDSAESTPKEVDIIDEGAADGAKPEPASNPTPAKEEVGVQAPHEGEETAQKVAKPEASDTLLDSKTVEEKEATPIANELEKQRGAQSDSAPDTSAESGPVKDREGASVSEANLSPKPAQRKPNRPSGNTDVPHRIVAIPNEDDFSKCEGYDPAKREPRELAPLNPEVPPFRHAVEDPTALPVRDLIVVAVVVFFAFLLIWWFSTTSGNTASSPLNVHQSVNAGTLTDSTFTEVSAWPTTSPTA